MKTTITLLVVFSCISLGVVHAAPPPGNDVCTLVFNSTDITVQQLIGSLTRGRMSRSLFQTHARCLVSCR
jgi:hypothetical protein